MFNILMLVLLPVNKINKCINISILKNQYFFANKKFVILS